ncbi:Plasmodium exported protein, unknown function [Plasmodium vivax]|uniref:Fam-l protein n=1 Tax=Plasmodium vivax TaxID=5855 RepID=A0A1G4EG18_PLAVI|nr:Plasmodium exported protein, unknown function [Plasmodium vivax]VUZ99737.1 Plasmodium exported protein, unknown function [Plasmodium vivax]
MVSLFNVIASIIFIWYNIGEYMKKEYKVYGIPDIIIHRSLAKHDFKKELYNRRIKVDLSNGAMYNREKNTSDNRLAYKDSSKIGSNNLGVHKKHYENKYGKKKGLEKLDSYFEKKVFKEIDNLYLLREKMKNDKKTYKKIIYNKYFIPLILFSLLPLLGLTFLVLFGSNDLGRGIISYCLREKHGTNTGDCKCKSIHQLYEYKGTLEIIGCVNYIYICVMTIIVITVIIYIFIKLIKYKKLEQEKLK